MWNLFTSLDVKIQRKPRANMTNLFQACCSVPDDATSLTLKNQNAHNQSFQMRYFTILNRHIVPIKSIVRKFEKSNKRIGKH